MTGEQDRRGRRIAWVTDYVTGLPVVALWWVLCRWTGLPFWQNLIGVPIAGGLGVALLRRLGITPFRHRG